MRRRDFVVYRHFDDGGKLLYVGSSISFLTRQVGHKSVSFWFKDVARIDLERHQTFLDMRIAEENAIKSERPKYNEVHGVYRRLRYRVPGMMSSGEVSAYLGCSAVVLATITKRGELRVSLKRHRMNFYDELDVRKYFASCHRDGRGRIAASPEIDEEIRAIEYERHNPGRSLMSDECAPWFDPNHPMNQMPPPRKLTVEELEKILNSEEDTPLEILPNGEVRYLAPHERLPRRPLTMRENLGGEYSGVATDQDRKSA